MKVVIQRVVFILIVCILSIIPSFTNASPYQYNVLEKQDTSYATTKRIVYRVYLETYETPERIRSYIRPFANDVIRHLWAFNKSFGHFFR